jgi:iron uptake system component EfeO
MSAKAVTGVVLATVAIVLAGCGGDSGPSAETARALRKSLAEHHAYLQANAEKLTHWTGTIILKVKEGAVTKAQSRFAAAQVPRGHIDPAAQHLDNAVDDGFRQIEAAIFGRESTAGMLATARQLHADAETVQQQLAAADPTPRQIVAGARQVLEESVNSDLNGEALPYSNAELTVVAAKVEGAGAAIEAVKPLLAEEDPDLLRRLEARLDAAYEELGEYGTLAREPEQSRPQEPGIAFVVFSELDQTAIDEVAKPIDALAQQLAEAEERL